MNKFTYMEDRYFSKGRKYIGASDMPTLTGINPSYKTPLELWKELTGKSEGFKGNERTKWGHIQEPTILAQYVKAQYSLEDSNDFITSRLWGDTQFKNLYSWTEAKPDGYDRFTAHADLLDLTDPENPIIIQAKNMGQHAADQRKRDINKGYDKNDLSSNGIPLGVYYQEQWEMFCYGIETAYVAVLIDGWNWKLYGPIKYNKSVVEKLLTLAIRMLECVDNNFPPDPLTWGDIIKLNPEFKKNTKSVVSEDDELTCRQMISEYGELDQKIKALNEKKDDIKNALGLYIGSHNYLSTPMGKTLASVALIAGSETISIKELKKHKDLYEQIEALGLVNKSEERRQLYIKGVAAGNIERWTLITKSKDKEKRSKKKYNKKEKKEAEALLKSLKVAYEWEKYNG